MDGNWPLQVYSCWEKESAIKKPRSTLDKAVLEGDPGGDGEEIEDDAIYEEEQDNDAKEDEMDEEFDTESKDEP